LFIYFGIPVVAIDFRNYYRKKVVFSDTNIGLTNIATKRTPVTASNVKAKGL